MTTHTNDLARTLAPPAQRADKRVHGRATTFTRPRDIVLDATTTGGRGAAPALEPPSAAGAQGAAAAALAGIWSSSVLVDATWTINEHRNAFLHVAGGGWKKLFNGTDAAFDSLVTLVAQAKQTRRPVTIREEADGLVHEIYLW